MEPKLRSQIPFKPPSPNPLKPTKEQIAKSMYLDDDLMNAIFRSGYKNGGNKTPSRPPQSFELFGSPPVFQKFEQPLENIFLISDTHFSRKGIITKATRPFVTVKQMNHVLTHNWNRAVQSDSLVFMLGDFGAMEMAAALSGQITYILGNHDKHLVQAHDYQLAEFDGKQFVLAHQPDRTKLPFEWDGWFIHGHTHNFDMWNYPFISGLTKTINVSVELINYAPISVQHLLLLDLESIHSMETIDSEPSRW